MTLKQRFKYALGMVLGTPCCLATVACIWFGFSNPLWFLAALFFGALTSDIERALIWGNAPDKS